MFKTLARAFVFTCFICTILPGLSKAQSQQQYPHYVIIGAFAIEKNAEMFSARAKRQNFQAVYKLNPNRNLFYVYVFTSADPKQTLQEARKVRRTTKFKDAWIYNGLLGEAPVASSSADVNPDTGKKIDVVSNPDSAQRVSGDTSVNNVDSTAVTSAQSNAGDSVNNAVEKKFYFDIYRASNNQTVDGDVDVIDAERARKVGTYKGNTEVKLTRLPNENMLLVCQVFGYRKEQRLINFDSPLNDTIVVDDKGNIVVPFELVRLQKGDIEVMYNVFFFKDAAIMRPDSRYEVNSLLEMLKENPAYKIRIHGHSNGNAPGKIITVGGDDFFSLTGSKDGLGTAKKLSEARAKAIRDYLVANGIAEDRMKVKAWGGKRPIYDKLGPRAQENVRVEIEILEDK